MPRPQRTIARPGEVTGRGLHTGADVTLRIEPAPAGSGVTFVRDDLGKARIPARFDMRREVQRRTALVGEREAEVHTVEHFLSCLYAFGIDNLEVHLDGPECPGMDGSARDFVALLDECGPETQDAPVRVHRPTKPVHVQHGNAGLVALPSQDDALTVSYTLDYDHPFLGVQHFSCRVDPETFRRELSGARTFCLEREAEALRAAGLGKGATYENTLVVGDDGVIGNEPRWPDEFARHKTLDLIGDLFLLGAPIAGHVVAHRSGHAANLALVEALLRPDAGGAAATDSGHDTDPSRTPSGLGPVQIRRILPHRYPFLLVDRVLEIDGFQRAVGVKCVTVGEPFFQGHYPGEPIMPGVLILEAMAQLAGILLLRKLELTGKVPVLLSIDRVKFRRAVVPGDRLLMEANTIRLSSGRGRVRCRSTVAGALVSEARLNFALTEPVAS